MEGEYHFLNMANASENDVITLTQMLFTNYNIRKHHQLFHVTNGSYEGKIGPVEDTLWGPKNENSSKISVFLRKTDGKTATLNLWPKQSISSLKDRLHQMYTIPKNEQRLSYDGVQLEDDFLVQDYNICQDATLHLDMRVRGGGIQLFGKIFTKPFELDVDFSEDMHAFWTANKGKSEVAVWINVNGHISQGIILPVGGEDEMPVEAPEFNASYSTSAEGHPIFTITSSNCNMFPVRQEACKSRCKSPNVRDSLISVIPRAAAEELSAIEKTSAPIRSKKTVLTPKYVESDDTDDSDETDDSDDTDGSNGTGDSDFDDFKTKPSQAKRVPNQKFKVTSPLPKTYKCAKPLCTFKTAHRGSLHNHSTSCNILSLPNECPVKPCAFKFSRMHQLDSHLECFHSTKIVVSHHKFSDEAELDHWRNEIMVNDYVKFSSRSKSTKPKHVLYCHRSGVYTCSTTPETRKRRSKNAGSIKCGICPCRLQISRRENVINVTYYETHVGHTQDPGKIGLTLPQKEELGAKLKLGVPKKKIIACITKNMGETVNRIDISTTKDLNNIAKQLKIGLDEQYHSNDADSVDAHVRRLQHEENSILVYKRQGELDSLYPKIEADDFLLGYMNTGQEGMFREFGMNTVFIDSTHGLNPYDFHLTTVVVTDAYLQGFPVAFFFHNRKTQDTYEACFQAMKSRTGKLTCSAFMSDDEKAFYNAWALVLGKPGRKLLCAWHVLHNWSKNLLSVPLAIRDTINAQMQAIMRLSHVPDFEVALETFVSKLKQNDNLKKFASYFIDNYVPRCKEWAYCHRFYAGGNTNMYLENLHKRLKHDYLNGKMTKRLDKGFEAVLECLAELQRNQIVKHYRKTLTPKDDALRKSHDKCKGVSTSKVTPYQNYWTVQSFVSTNEFLQYEISVSPNPCPALKDNTICELQCPDCHTCVHKYRCTCLNMGVQTVMCKHIHLVCIYLREKEVVPIQESSDDEMDLVVDTCSHQEGVEGRLQAHLVDLARQTRVSNLLDLTAVKTEFEEACTLVKDVEGKKILQNLIRKARFALASHNNSDIVQMPMTASVRKQPANTKIKPQKRFFRTSAKQPRKKKISDQDALALLSNDNIVQDLCKVRLLKGTD